jgi:osmotically inducible protein OsmC
VLISGTLTTGLVAADQRNTEGHDTMAAERTAHVTWHGDLPHGNGVIDTSGSGALGNLPVSWASRAERSDGKTSPEELIAAAHASCFSMALAHTLAQGGHAPEQLDVSATVTFSLEGGPKITRSVLEVRGTVPGIDQDGFAEAAQGAGQNCPVSQALKGSVEIVVNPTLA